MHAAYTVHPTRQTGTPFVTQQSNLSLSFSDSRKFAIFTERAPLFILTESCNPNILRNVWAKA